MVAIVIKTSGVVYPVLIFSYLDRNYVTSRIKARLRHITMASNSGRTAKTWMDRSYSPIQQWDDLLAHCTIIQPYRSVWRFYWSWFLQLTVWHQWRRTWRHSYRCTKPFCWGEMDSRWNPSWSAHWTCHKNRCIRQSCSGKYNFLDKIIFNFWWLANSLEL